MEEKIDIILKNLNEAEREEIYKKLRYNHVLQDAICILDSEYGICDKNVASNIAYDYVYYGDYDCNLSHWDNLINLANRHL